MSIELTCPTGHVLMIADAWAGRSGRCPVCKAPVQVPALARAAAEVLSVANHSAPLPKEAPSSVEAYSAPATVVQTAAAVPTACDLARPSIAPATQLPANDDGSTPGTLSTGAAEMPSALHAPPPLPVEVRKAALPAPIGDSPGAPEPQRAFPPVGTPQSPIAELALARSIPTAPNTLTSERIPPPLPVVVATSMIAASPTPADCAVSVNGSPQHAARRPRARTSDDAVFENIESVFNALPQPNSEARLALLPATTVAEVAPPATPEPAVLLPDVAIDSATLPAATGYQPDADKRRMVLHLAVAMAALSLFCMAPAFAHLNLGSAPNWARAVLLISILQLAYAAWVASIPDWATLRSSMIVLTVVAAIYGLTMTVALTTPRENTLPLDLTEVRRQAVLWCAVVLLLSSLLAYSCGRAAWRWRRMLAMLYG